MDKLDSKKAEAEAKTLRQENLQAIDELIIDLGGDPDKVDSAPASELLDNLIKEIEEEATADSLQKVDEWMRKYANKLHT